MTSTEVEMFSQLDPMGLPRITNLALLLKNFLIYKLVSLCYASYKVPLNTFISLKHGNKTDESILHLMV